MVMVVYSLALGFVTSQGYIPNPYEIIIIIPMIMVHAYSLGRVGCNIVFRVTVCIIYVCLFVALAYQIATDGVGPTSAIGIYYSKASKTYMERRVCGRPGRKFYC